MQVIWAEWTNGDIECVDTVESEAEARNLVGEYQMAYGPAAKRVWSKEVDHAEDACTDCRERSNCL